MSTSAAGGHAVAFHGYPRYTGDIDFFIRPTPANASKLVALLQDFGFESNELEVETFTQPDQAVQLGRPPNRIDLLAARQVSRSEAGLVFETPGV